MERRKLWIIGDSFTGTGNGQWTVQCCEKFKGDRYYVSSDGSRNTQTIIDILLKKLHLIEPNDLVILMLPTLDRVRLPLLTPRIDVEHSNEYIYKEAREKHLDYFVGSHQYEMLNVAKSLEPPLNGLDENKLEDSDFELNINLQKIINASNASRINFSEILQSLEKFVYFELGMFSWTDEYPYPIVGATEIKNEVGYWESMHQLWKESNGESGGKDDFHWSPKMQKGFSEYVMKKYSKYFNI